MTSVDESRTVGANEPMSVMSMSAHPLGGPPDSGPEADAAAPVRQISLFDADLSAPSPDDLAGLLAGPGQVVRMGGTARVSVVVADRWRVRALLAEYATRGLGGIQVETVGDHFGVRTAFVAALAPLAAAWLRGASTQPPVGFRLTGARLRLWAIAAGQVEPQGYRLGLGEPERLDWDGDHWDRVRAALAAAGLPGALLGPRSGGPAYRIAGRRRLRRLGELVGSCPPQAPPEAWAAR